MNRFLVPAALASLLLLAPPPAAAQDDQYLKIYALIQEADGLKNNQESSRALTRYLEAHGALVRLQKMYPEWNPRVVSYRLNYLTSRIGELSSRVPPATVTRAVTALTNPPAAPPPQSAAVAELESQLNDLKAEVRQLQNEKTVLDAKLKEAWTAQPAAVDPRELAKAQDQVKSLRKENELLKVNLDQQKAKSVPPADAKTLEQLNRDLAEANHKLAVQADAAYTLALEKQALQNRMNSLIPAAWNETNIVTTRTALAEANRKLAEQADTIAKLSRERDALQAQVGTPALDAEAAAALRQENEILKRQVTELTKAVSSDSRGLALQLVEAQVQLAALQSDKEILRRENLALEEKLQQLSATAASPADASRIKQLEHERDELQIKLDVAQKELAGRNDKTLADRVAELSAQLEQLRTRLAVLEAQPVPYTAEELALFRTPEMSPPTPVAAKKNARELPPGAVALEAEARRDFAAQRFEQAEQKYLQVLRQDETNAYIMANLAAVQLELKRFDEAEKNIMQAIGLAPDDAYTLSLLGVLRFRQGRLDEALDVLGRAAELDPGNAEIQNYLGLTLGQKGLRVPAETALRKAIELEPDYGRAHYNLAVLYITRKPPETEMARLHYKKAIAGGIQRDDDLEKLLSSGASAETP